jgi:8-hydroxy-5-deazaflavin:NADPH oxidoreductase
MSYSIVGFGALGQALARAFARKGIDVAVATTRSPEAIASAARSIGPTVAPKSLKDALATDVILLAVPFWSHRDVAQALPSWRGKFVIDATNAYGVSLADLGDLPSAKVVANAFHGARLVKGFNHLPARVIAQDPTVGAGRRVIFLSSDDEDAIATVAALVEQLGYAPVSLGKIAEGGQLVQARNKSWGALIFHDLFKLQKE